MMQPKAKRADERTAENDVTESETRADERTAENDVTESETRS